VADGQPRFTIARCNADGTLDLTFGDPEQKRSVSRAPTMGAGALPEVGVWTAQCARSV